METRVSSATREVIIGDNRPTVIIGERINPTGRSKISQALRSGNLDIIRSEALAQVRAGADILDVNVGMFDVNETALLPQVMRAVMDSVDVPLCLDTDNPEALEAALNGYNGRPIINSVTGAERSLAQVLPLARKYGSAVIGLLQDDSGLPKDAQQRLAIARKIVERAEAAGLSRNDIIIDCLTLAIGAEASSGQAVIESITLIKENLGVNLVLGASNISFGLPDRDLLNNAFVAIAIAAGVSCIIADVNKVRPTVLSVDLILGKDRYARRYIQAYRNKQRPTQ